MEEGTGVNRPLPRSRVSESKNVSMGTSEWTHRDIYSLGHQRHRSNRTHSIKIFLFEKFYRLIYLSMT